MSSSSLILEESTRILVPLTLPEPEPIAPWLIDFLCPLDIHLLGCYVVKDQTTPEQAREQFEDEATRQLDQVVERFRQVGAEVDSRLVFTHDVVDTTDRIANELGVDLVISPTSVERITNLLCVVSDDAHLGRMQQCIRALLEESVVPVTLLRVRGEPAEEADMEEEAVMLDGLKQRLVDEGIDPERIETRFVEDEDPAERTIEVSGEFDVVIMAEAERKLRDRLLRDAPSPIIVVRSRGAE